MPGAAAEPTTWVDALDRQIEALTMRGRIVAIRRVRAEDAGDLTDLHTGSSAASRRLRFFTAAPSVPAEVERLLRPAGRDRDCLVAVGDGDIIGVASFERLSDNEAECAVFVADDWQGEGVGTLLLESLAAHARRAGYDDLLGTVLTRNRGMLRVSTDLAPAIPARRGEDATTVVVRIPTRPDDAALAAAGKRERIAERRSLRAVLAPASVAVIGAGQRSGVGHQVLRSLVEQRFVGPVYPVNPHAAEIAGQRAYPDLESIGAPVDLAIIALPGPAVPTVIDQCADAGVRAAVVLSAGFAESAPEGARQQAAIVRVTRRRGLRLVGPNCLGVINTDPSVRLAATFALRIPPPGRLAVATQSGAVGIAILDAVVESGIGVSSFVSLGDKADVSTNDLLAYWYDDPSTDAVALYVESFGNPRRFSWLARAIADRKPVLAVKSGRSAGGHRAGASHTAAAAVPDVWVDALFRQAGVIRTDTLAELLDASRAVTGQPLPGGPRVAIIGNAGGFNVLAADAAAAAGLQVVELSPALRTRLAAGSAHPAGTGNPVDLGADATADSLGEAIVALGESGEVDALVITYVATRVSQASAMLAAVGKAGDRIPHCPAVAVVVGTKSPARLGCRGIPVFGLPEDAVRALGHATAYATWRRRPTGRRLDLPGVDPGSARETAGAALRAGVGWQPITVAIDLLAAYGIPVAPTRCAADRAAAEIAAEELGYPVVVKAARPDLVHKSDVGAVFLGLESRREVGDAYAAVGRALGTRSPAVVVQHVVSAGVELAAGIMHHPVFGSLVMVGAGGTTTDLWDDHEFRLLPVTDVEAASMWRGLRVAPLLTGYRGSVPSDTGAVEQLLQRLGRLAEDLPEVVELDLNPIIVGPNGAVVVDVKLRLSEPGDEPESYTHSLEKPYGAPVPP